METSNTSTGETLFNLTSYAAATPANLSASPGTDKERMTQDICGHGSERPLANYDLNTQSWRMSEATLLSDSPAFLETWPASGMTHNGTLFQQPQLVRHIKEKGSLSLPTPQARDYKGISGRSKKRKKPMCLPGALGGVPNPEFVEWLMGFPKGWTDLKD